jgi:hypothetical protein
MCFDILEGGNSRFFNDKAKDEQMPKVRYVLLRNSERQCPGAAADEEEEGGQGQGQGASGEGGTGGNIVVMEEADRIARKKHKGKKARTTETATTVAAAAVSCIGACLGHYQRRVQSS